MKCIKFFVIVTSTNFQKFETMPSSYTRSNLKKFIVQINHFIRNFKVTTCIHQFWFAFLQANQWTSFEDSRGDIRGATGLRPWTIFVSTIYGRFNSYSRWAWLGRTLLRRRWSVVHLWQGFCNNLISVVTGCITEIDEWMSSNRLKLNADTTQFIWLGTHQQLHKVDSNQIQLGSDVVKLQTTVNNLGVTILTTTYQWRNTFSGFASLHFISYVRSDLSVHHWHEQHANLSCTRLYRAD